MRGARKLKERHLVLLCTGVMVFLPYCRKDKLEPYSEQILFVESFDAWENMTTTPENVTLDTSQVKVANGKLELTFDPATYGGTALGCELVRPDFIVPSGEHIGVRVVLDSGYFQTSQESVPGVGLRERWARMRVLFNTHELWVPAYYEPVNCHIEGHVFELIRDGMEDHFLVDGVAHPLSERNFMTTTMSQAQDGLRVWFEIGRWNEPSPEVDHLGIDRFEIFTWTGARPE